MGFQGNKASINAHKERSVKVVKLFDFWIDIKTNAPALDDVYSRENRSDNDPKRAQIMQR